MTLRAFPKDSVISPIPALMQHLKKLTIEGDFSSVLKIVEGLDYPRRMDELTLIVCKSRAEDVLTILAPLARNHVEREGRRRVRLGLSVKCYSGCLSIQASSIDNTGGEAQRFTFATFTVHQRMDVLDDDSLQMCANFIAQVSMYDIVHFGGDLSMEVVKQVVPTMPHIQELHLVRARLEKGFLLLDPKQLLYGRSFSLRFSTCTWRTSYRTKPAGSLSYHSLPTRRQMAKGFQSQSQHQANTYVTM